MESPISKYNSLDVNNQWNLRDNEVTNNPKHKGRLGRIINRMRSNSMSLGKIIGRIGEDIQKVSPDKVSNAKDLVALRDKISAKGQNWQEKTSFIGRHLGGHGNVKRSVDELSNLVDAKLLTMFTGKVKDPKSLTPIDKMMAQQFYEGFTKADMTGMEAVQFIRLVEGSGVIEHNAASADDFWDKFANMGFANAPGLKELHAAMQGDLAVMDNPLVSHFASQPNGIRNITNVLKLPDADKEWKIENRNLLIETGSVTPEEGIQLRLEGYKQREAAFDEALKDNPGLVREKYAETKERGFKNWMSNQAEMNKPPDMNPILPGFYLGNNNYSYDDDAFYSILDKINSKINLIYRFEDKKGDNDKSVVPKIDTDITFSEIENILKSGTNTLVSHFDQICEKERNRNGDGTVLFQCAVGKSRSAASLVAVIADKYDLSVDNAIKVVSDGRPNIGISPDLKSALYIWEARRKDEDRELEVRTDHVLSDMVPEMAFGNNYPKLAAIIEGTYGFDKDPKLAANILTKILEMPKAEEYLKAIHLDSKEAAKNMVQSLSNELYPSDFDEWLEKLDPQR